MSNSLTLLLITETQLARVDVTRGRKPRVKNVWLRERILTDSMATLVEAALVLGPKRTGDVWVFSSAFWTGVVTLDPGIAASLDGDELEQAIALEAENFSGISGFDSQVGTKRLPVGKSGERRWWVTQFPQSDWWDAKNAVAQFGGTLKGMGHPAVATLPDSAAVRAVDRSRGSRGDSSELSWRLLQVFEEQTLGISGVGSEVVDVIALGTLESRRNQSQLSEWLEFSDLSPSDREKLARWDRSQAAAWAAQDDEASGPIVWVTDRSTPLPSANGLGVSLHLVKDLRSEPVAGDVSTQKVQTVADADLSRAATDESPRTEGSQPGTDSATVFGDEAFGAWAEAIAGSLTVDRQGNVPGLAVAVMDKEPMSTQTAVLVACGIALFAALGCYGLYAMTDSTLQSMNEQVATLEEQNKTLAANKKELAALEKTLAEQKTALAEVRSRSDRLESNLESVIRIRQLQQTRCLELLTAIAESHQQDVWIQSLTWNDGRVTVEGVAVREQDVATFTSELEILAGQHGCQVHPAQTVHTKLELIDFTVGVDVSNRVLPATTFRVNTDGPTAAETAKVSSR